MKHILLLLLLSTTAFTTTTQAQTEEVSTLNEFAYHYGIVIGYEFKNSYISYRRFPMQSLLQGVQAYLNGSTNMTEADAEKVVQTMKDKIKSAQAANTFEGENYDFSNMGYAYGVLVGSNWKTYHITATDYTLEDLQEGIKAVFYEEGTVASEAEAQAVVLQRYKELQGDQEALKMRDNKTFLERNLLDPEILTLPSGVQYKIVQNRVGGPIGNTKKKIKLHYIGTLLDGTIFEQTVEGEPLVTTLDNVLPGWKSLLPVMREDETVIAYIPPSLGFGNQTRGKVPANSILVYEITVLDVLD